MYAQNPTSYKQVKLYQSAAAERLRARIDNQLTQSATCDRHMKQILETLTTPPGVRTLLRLRVSCAFSQARLTRN